MLVIAYNRIYLNQIILYANWNDGRMATVLPTVPYLLYESLSSSHQNSTETVNRILFQTLCIFQWHPAEHCCVIVAMETSFFLRLFVNNFCENILCVYRESMREISVFKVLRLLFKRRIYEKRAFIWLNLPTSSFEVEGGVLNVRETFKGRKHEYVEEYWVLLQAKHRLRIF